MWLQKQGVSPDDILTLGGIDATQIPTETHNIILAKAEAIGPLT